MEELATENKDLKSEVKSLKETLNEANEERCDYRRTSGHMIPSRELHVDCVLSFSL